MIQLPHNKIACVPMFDPDTTESGLLYIPEVAKERSDQGIVKYVGTDCKLVKPGDHVLFSGYTGTLVKLEGEGLLIVMEERFVVAVIESANTDIPGLYFKDKEGKYWTATYEQAMVLITQAFEENPDLQKMKVSVEKPKPEDYDADD